MKKQSIVFWQFSTAKLFQYAIFIFITPFCLWQHSLTHAGYNRLWKQDTSSEPKCQLRLRWTALVLDAVSYPVLHWKPQHQHTRGTGKGDGSSPRWSMTAFGPLVPPHSETLWNSSFARETQWKASLSDLQLFLFSWTQLTVHVCCLLCVFCVVDSMFVTTFLQMLASRTLWKLCIQTRGFLNHRPVTSATHLLHGWNMNRAFNFALWFLHSSFYMPFVLFMPCKPTEFSWKGTSLFELWSAIFLLALFFPPSKLTYYHLTNWIYSFPGSYLNTCL